MRTNFMDALNKTLSILDQQKSFHKLPQHTMLKEDYWTLSAWRENEAGFLMKGDILDNIEKLEKELANDLENNKNTTPRPKYFTVNRNILTLIGLTQSAKRDTAEVATSNDWVSLGTSSTAETENDTGLAAEDSGGSYARRQLSVNGSRKVTNQTAKYGVLFSDTMVSSVPKTFKEAGLHWASTGSSNIHARVTYTDFNFSAGDLFVVQINELMQNGSV